MYNRYIPQQDGTYQKNRIPSPTLLDQPPKPVNEPEKEHIRKTQPASTFLHQLLPKGLDTGDLLVIVLLLLMAGDGKENDHTWLLTLALYLFL